ncbi:protein of unknown function [Tenacibaculum sp. 190524A02b]|uniref:Uncharacterized protein n=1 Tax=Tenacibaculum vairaonense TaxID=3137860 RepID=A0ABP1FBF3_9FLAO
MSNDDLSIIRHYNCREIIVWYNSLLFCIGTVHSFNNIYNMNKVYSHKRLTQNGESYMLTIKFLLR